MKKLLTVFLTIILIATLSFSAWASSASLATELTNLRKYYTKNNELTLFEETLALASVGMLTGKTAYIPESDGNTLSLAQRILAYSASGKLPENYNEPEILIDLQEENGAFGDMETHCLSMLALTSRKATYNSAKAYGYILSQQEENGSFSGSVKDTALAVCVLSLSQNDKEMEAKNKAVKYLTAFQAGNEIDLCWQIIGITDGGIDPNTVADRNLLETLLSYQNTADYSFYPTKNTNTSDEKATVMALTALDAMNKDSSMFQRLATDGELSFYNREDVMPLIIFVIALLIISVGFWGYIFLHKKSTKTLEETKTY